MKKKEETKWCDLNEGLRRIGDTKKAIRLTEIRAICWEALW